MRKYFAVLLNAWSSRFQDINNETIISLTDDTGDILGQAELAAKPLIPINADKNIGAQRLILNAYNY